MTSSDPMFIENTFIAHFTSIIAPQLDDINTDLSHVSAFGHLSAEDGTKLTQPVAVEAFGFLGMEMETYSGNETSSYAAYPSSHCSASKHDNAELQNDEDDTESQDNHTWHSDSELQNDGDDTSSQDIHMWHSDSELLPSPLGEDLPDEQAYLDFCSLQALKQPSMRKFLGKGIDLG
ncbi:hypothetical protein MRB53_028602 [Persea americana]|uniref:Uncharacterized protein n=1 Tax=Persea americana TaxID=3435 RepID=A0ACC2KGG3_PERAE|nr:hypothetical protein MRB53_028602 [Persea americana]